MYYGGYGEKESELYVFPRQAGCSIGCPFCATGQQGFERNLTPARLPTRYYIFRAILEISQNKDGSFNNNAERGIQRCFMGMGEPMANYDNLWQAIRTMNSPDCLKLGARNMTISHLRLGYRKIKRLNPGKAAGWIGSVIACRG